MNQVIIVETLTVGPLEANCYILGDSGTKAALVIDPGADEEKIRAAIGRLRLTPTALVLTHGHVDHLGAAGALKREWGIPLLLHQADLPMLSRSASRFFLPELALPEEVKPDRLLEDGDTVNAGNLAVSVLHTPGHSPGSVCLLLRREREPWMVFTGDTLFAEGVGRTDFPGGSTEQLQRSIQMKLLTLADDTMVYPGHGPATTIGVERRGNPFLGSGE